VVRGLEAITFASPNRLDFGRSLLGVRNCNDANAISYWKPLSIGGAAFHKLQSKHKLLIAYVLAWFALRTFVPGLLFTYMFTESLLILDAVCFIGIVYLVFERKNL
jgi:hypothetical protein